MSEDNVQNAEQEQEGSSSDSMLAINEGRGGVVGVKAGMTQVYDSDGRFLAVTVINLQPNVVTQVKAKEKHGYTALQVGVLTKDEKHTGRPEKGHAKASGYPGFYHYQEFRLDNADLSKYSAGQVLSAGFLKAGDFIDIRATSKGKGFQGPVKRHNMRGGPKAHGASKVERSGGSIGNRTDPGRVWKGKKMAGQMGNKSVTVQNLKVVRVDVENNLLLVHGAVPGPKSGVLSIRRAVKKG